MTTAQRTDHTPARLAAFDERVDDVLRAEKHQHVLYTNAMAGDEQAYARYLELLPADEGRGWGDWLLEWSCWYSRNPREAMTLMLMHRHEPIWVQLLDGPAERRWTPENLLVRSCRSKEAIAPIIDALVTRLRTESIPTWWLTPEYGYRQWDQSAIEHAVRTGQHAEVVADMQADRRRDWGSWLCLSWSLRQRNTGLKAPSEHGIEVLHKSLPLVAGVYWTPGGAARDIRAEIQVVPDDGSLPHELAQAALRQLERAVASSPPR